MKNKDKFCLGARRMTEHSGHIGKYGMLPDEQKQLELKHAEQEWEKWQKQ